MPYHTPTEAYHLGVASGGSRIGLPIRPLRCQLVPAPHEPGINLGRHLI